MGLCGVDVGEPYGGSPGELVAEMVVGDVDGVEILACMSETRESEKGRED